MVKTGVLMGVVAALCGCGGPPAAVPAKATPAAKVENRVAEKDLTRVTLSAEAEQRLGIALATVSERTAGDQLRVAGDVLAIPGRVLIVSAPAAGVVVPASAGQAVGQTVRLGQPIFRLTPMLAPQRDLKTTYEADLLSAKARLDTAAQQQERARQLLRDMAGSQRNVELAGQEFGQAKAAYDAAQERLRRLETHPLDADVDMRIESPADGILRQILAAGGQNVSAGAPLFEVADLRSVWLRVPVYAGQVRDLAPADVIAVRDVDGSGPALQGRRVEAPPTADPLAVTADLYFAVANSNLQLRPGQRLMATMPLKSGSRKGLSTPLSAILYDIYGGAWVYVQETPRVYRRQRVEVAESRDGAAFVTRGLAAGMNVVTQGAAELFGTEFGAGH